MANPTPKLPFITDELLAALEHMFPAAPILPSTDMPSIYFQAGQQDVLRRLRQHSAQQREVRR